MTGAAAPQTNEAYGVPRCKELATTVKNKGKDVAALITTIQSSARLASPVSLRGLATMVLSLLDLHRQLDAFAAANQIYLYDITR